MKCLCVGKQGTSVYIHVYSILASCMVFVTKTFAILQRGHLPLGCVLDRKPLLLRTKTKVWRRRNGVKQNGRWDFW